MEKKFLNYMGRDVMLILHIEKEVTLSLATQKGKDLVEYYTDGIVEKEFSNTTKNGIDFYAMHIKKFNFFVIVNIKTIHLYISDESYNQEIKTPNEALNSLLNENYKQMIQEKIEKRKFAIECANIAREMNVSFSVSITYRGNKEKINNFMSSLQKLIDSEEYIIPDSIEDLEFLNIDFQGASKSRLYAYIKSCLMAGKILTY